MEFKAENFNFEEVLLKIKKTVLKPNILVCGATGVGKSSLINDIFGDDVARVGEGEPITRGISMFSSQFATVNLFDSEGYELGEEKQLYFKNNIISCIDKFKSENPDDINKNIHEVWYCISAANKRVTDTDIEVVKSILSKKVPIAFVLTQIDSVDEQELQDLTSVLKKEFSEIAHFNYCVTDDEKIKTAVSSLIEKEKLIDWAENVLPDALKEGLVSALKGNLDHKKKLIQSKIIPIYVASSAATALSPIPFSDAVILVPIQISMSIHIMSIYGMDKVKGAVTSVISSQIVSQIGKIIAKSVLGNLLKLIPGLGTGVGAAVNAAVASSITTVLGLTISQLCYNYSKALLEGKKVDILDFFNSDSFNSVLEKVLKSEGK